MNDKLKELNRRRVELVSALGMTIPQIFATIAAEELGCENCPIAKECEEYNTYTCYELWVIRLKGEDLNG